MKILIFSAVWCPGCIVMEKVWDKIKETNKDIEIVKYDSEEDDLVFDEWNIGDKIPVNILVDKNNNELERLVGEKSLKVIEEAISKYREE
jgi:thiol-disulfide isomerase/thioredoxin